MNESVDTDEIDRGAASAAAGADGPGAEGAAAPDGKAAEPKAPAFKYVHSQSLPDLLEHLNITVMATTFQAGRVLSFSGGGGRCSLLMRAFTHPMGLAVNDQRMALVCGNQVVHLVNQTDLVDQEGKRPDYDAYFVPRRMHVTGDIAGHEAAWGIDPDVTGAAASASAGAASDDLLHSLWVVNTRFSCLATLDQRWSFVPRWKPAFITKLAAEDRCHLNGMAMEGGRPRYVTMLAPTDTAQGWRDRKTDGGCVIDVRNDEIVARDMAMPHSPRVYRGRLWVLESGRAELQYVDPETGRRHTVTRLPGYVRGLAFYDRFAFVGLSKAREKRMFGGLPIEEHKTELQCGIQVVDLDSGKVVAFIQFEAGCEELFDVQVLPNARRANIIGFTKETVNGIFVLPKGEAAKAV